VTFAGARELLLVAVDREPFLFTTYRQGALIVHDAPYTRLADSKAGAGDQLAARLAGGPPPRRRARPFRDGGTAADPPFYLSESEYRRRARHLLLSWNPGDWQFSFESVPQQAPYTPRVLLRGTARDLADLVKRVVDACWDELAPAG